MIWFIGSLALLWMAVHLFLLTASRVEKQTSFNTSGFDLLQNNWENFGLELLEHQQRATQENTQLIELKRNQKWKQRISKHFSHTKGVLTWYAQVTDAGFVLLAPRSVYQMEAHKNRLRYLLPVSVPVFQSGTVELNGQQRSLLQGTGTLHGCGGTMQLSNPTQETCLILYIYFKPCSIKRKYYATLKRSILSLTLHLKSKPLSPNLIHIVQFLFMVQKSI